MKRGCIWYLASSRETGFERLDNTHSDQLLPPAWGGVGRWGQLKNSRNWRSCKTAAALFVGNMFVL